MKSMLVLLLAFNVTNRYLMNIVQGNKIVGVFPDRIYHLYDEEKIFASAEDFCEERDGYLAVIKDPADLAIIAKNLFEDYSDNSIANETRNITQFYWIGLERNERKKWGFTDGSPYRAATRLAFTAWNTTEEKDYNCAGIVTAGLQTPTLRQQDCFQKSHFICQYDARPCVPKLILDAPLKTSPDDVYRICDTEAAQSQRQRISNECDCPAGNVAHSFMEKVYCNSKNWYNSAVCISGCPPPRIPFNGVLIDPLETYWEGDKITVMCMDGKATEESIYRYQLSLRCMEGGLWFGANVDKLCVDSADLNNGNNRSAALKRYVLETGSRTELQCDIPGQKDGIKLESWLWYKGSNLLNGNVAGNNKYGVDKASGTLKIDKFSPSSTGSYTCFGRYKGTILSGRSYFVSISSADYNTSGTSSFKISLMFLDVRLLFSFVLIILYKVC